MSKDARPWAFEQALSVADGDEFESSKSFALGMMLSNARQRGLELDADSLTHHQNSMFPGDPSRRVWKAKEA